MFKAKLGFLSLFLGVAATILGSNRLWEAKADVLSPSILRGISVSFYVGIGLIVLSVVFFVWAGASGMKE